MAHWKYTRATYERMSLLDGIEFLTSTVEHGSFAAAARKLGVTPSAVSRRVALLESELGVRLLQRTTRTLRLTEDGIAFHARCVRVLDELHEARDAIAKTKRKPAGILRVDAPIALGRALLAPALPAFLAKYPEIRLDLTLRDQLVDPIAEGLDVLVRIGDLRDSALIARRLGESGLGAYASPAFVKKHGTPMHPRDLVRFPCLGFLADGRPRPFTLESVDGTSTTVEVGGQCNATDSDVLVQLALAGRGIAMMFDFLAAPHLAKGHLVPVLPTHASSAWPIHALYPSNRHLLPKVRVFLDFVGVLVKKSCSRAPRP